MRKLMICVDITNESIDTFKGQLEKFEWESWTEVHFVHGFETQVYADTFYFASYPLESQLGDIESSVMTLLEGLAKTLVPDSFNGNVYTKCIFGSSSRLALRDYAEEEKIDEMVIETRGKHGFTGLFSSSFAEYMVGHAPCRLLILRE